MMKMMVMILFAPTAAKLERCIVSNAMKSFVQAAASEGIIPAQISITIL
jgi:hypothetical protein